MLMAVSGSAIEGFEELTREHTDNYLCARADKATRARQLVDAI
jgi:hypothetical protein